MKHCFELLASLVVPVLRPLQTLAVDGVANGLHFGERSFLLYPFNIHKYKFLSCIGYDGLCSNIFRRCQVSFAKRLSTLSHYLFTVFPTLSHLPKVTFTEHMCNFEPDFGSCDANLPRYFYDAVIGECAQFTYGGCDGNENNFLTHQQCMQACKGVNSTSKLVELSQTSLLNNSKILQICNGS